MKKIQKISDSEYEVMEVLWASDDYMEVSAVHAALSKVRKWAYNTVGTFLIRLNGKGFLDVKKHGRANSYYPLITEEEYIKSQTEEFLQTIHKGSKRSLIAALYDSDTDNEELDALIRMVENKGKN
ncbi:MAG: BlaI/MecI/CopY family transcriptional regulator [bacterium]|nr:BlaI/MecI/CopY family transcriptional regulator [bacterium]